MCVCIYIYIYTHSCLVVDVSMCVYIYIYTQSQISTPLKADHPDRPTIFPFWSLEHPVCVFVISDTRRHGQVPDI